MACGCGVAVTAGPISQRGQAKGSAHIWLYHRGYFPRDSWAQQRPREWESATVNGHMEEGVLCSQRLCRDCITGAWKQTQATLIPRKLQRRENKVLQGDLSSWKLHDWHRYCVLVWVFNSSKTSVHTHTRNNLHLHLLDRVKWVTSFVAATRQLNILCICSPALKKVICNPATVIYRLRCLN